MKAILFSLILLLSFGFSNINSINEDCKMGEENVVQWKDENDPTISFRIMFFVGSQNDPQGKEGLNYLTAKLLSEGGTTKNSYETILEKLFPLAAGYSFNPSTEVTTFTGRVHKDNFEEYYPLFTDALLNPGFYEEDFKRVKDEALNYLRTTLKYSSDEELGKAVLYTKIFGGTPYGHILQGSISGLESITLDDVRTFYSTYYARNNYVLGISGSFDQKLIDRLQNDLKKLLGNNPPKADKPKYSPVNGLNVTIVEKQAAASAISIGFPIDITRGSKEWYALAVANSWFGEHRNQSSHLYQVIREKRGLNYGDYSYIENFPEGGMRQMPPVNVPRRQQIFEIWIRPVPNETRHFALRAALRELRLLVDNGLTEDQFQLTKNFLKKYILQFAPSNNEKLGYALDDKFYGLTESHLDTFKRMLDELTREDVNNAVKKYLQYKNLQIVFITNNGAELKTALAKNLESSITYSSPKPKEVMDEDNHIMKHHLDIPLNQISILNVEELFR